MSADVKTNLQVPANEFVRQIDYRAWVEGERVEWVDRVWEMLDERDAEEDNFWRRYQVDLEPRVMGEWELEKHDIPQRSYERLHHIFSEGVQFNRDTGYGPITTLKKGGTVWMSDTRAEILEHSPFLNKLWWLESTEPRVLINGLGLGMAVKAALVHNASHVDVVEIDGDVIEMVGSAFADNPKVTIHHEDAFKIKWPKGTQWTLAWHDIWPTIDEDNIPEMNRLRDKYIKRVSWQASWQRKGCIALRKKSKQFKAALERGDWAEVRRIDPNF